MSTQALTAISTSVPADPLVSQVMTLLPQSSQHIGSFGNMIANSINRVDQKLADANALATAFVLDDSVPVHQVTFALEQARLSLELMLQVRGRLLESYQQIMNMQL